jgi:molybdate transport system substrate-binding protein
MIKRLWLLFLTGAIMISACGAPAPTVELRTLTVFAAASLADAFDEIIKNFEAANPGVTVKLNFGGSQSLRTQIEQGAQADVFASANTKEMDALVTGNFVAAESPRIFLTNQLVVIMPADNPAGLKELADLAGSGLKLVLAAQEVPVGNYSLQMLDTLDATFGDGFKEQVLANVVSYENDVKQVVAKVQLGEADAGIVYLSDTVAAPDLQKIDIPAENNVVASYPLAALTQSKSPALAQAFMDYVLSANGQSILKKWGFLPVN